MVYPIGGIYCGLWRRERIIQNDVFFPEELRYEDNYWATLIKAYVQRVTFVEKIGYYYRQNSMSTVHKRNQEYQFDRIEIENRLMEEFRNRGLLDRFWRAEEYIYTQRYVINSFWLFLDTFDIMPKQKTKRIISDLKQNAPNWKSNSYYKKLTPRKQKIKDLGIATCPFAFLTIWKMRERLKEVLRKQH